MTSRNPHTGDAQATKPSTEQYREGWDRIFGRNKEKETLDRCCGKCSPCSGHSKESDKDEAGTD